MQHPTAWDPVYRAELEASRAFNKGKNARRTYSPITVASRRPRRTIQLDPFEDPRLQGAEESAESLAIPETYLGEDAGHPLGARPWAVSRDFSISSDPSCEEPLDDQPDRLYSQSQWGEVELLPSPAASDVPIPPSRSGRPGSPEADLEGQRGAQQIIACPDVITTAGRRSTTTPSFHTRTTS